jgi:hypothetical protein
MILLVASQFDQQAFRLARNWTKHGACLLTAQDLSRPGWLFSPDVLAEWKGVAGDQVFDASALTGILNCLAEIDEHELGHIVAEDRAYVAAEMNAFLLSWQSRLSCPVINRPTPNCLLGPGWRIEKWVLTAAKLGIPVVDMERSSERMAQTRIDGLEGSRTVTVIGDVVISNDKELSRWAKTLARAAGVTVATFYFSSSADTGFLGVTLRPDLDNQAVADALLSCFEVPTC